MTKDQVKAVLARVPTWPDDRQHELAELALEIKAASEEEVKVAFALFRRA